MAARKNSKKRKPIKRQTRRFQLRVEHPQDQHVAEVLDYAKSQRREVTMIREAVSLFWALENGNLEALFEKFPQYKAKLNPSGGEGQMDEMMQMLAMMVGKGETYLMKSTQPSIPATVAPIAPVAIVKEAPAASADDIADAFLSAFM